MVLMSPGEITHRITLVFCSVLVINTTLSKLFSFISDSFQEVLFHFIAVCAGTCRDLKFLATVMIVDITLSRSYNLVEELVVDSDFWELTVSCWTMCSRAMMAGLKKKEDEQLNVWIWSLYGFNMSGVVFLHTWNVSVLKFINVITQHLAHQCQDK